MSTDAAPKVLGRGDLERAVAAGVLGAARAEALWQFLGSGPQSLRPRFDLAHVVWYAGALMVIGAMDAIERYLRDSLPSGLRALRPAHAP
jgi:hypothetical protein